MNEGVCRVFQRPFAWKNDPENQANLHAGEQIISARIFLGPTYETYTLAYKSYDLLPYKIIWLISLVQSVAPRQIRTEII